MVLITIHTLIYYLILSVMGDITQNEPIYSWQQAILGEALTDLSGTGLGGKGGGCCRISEH